MIQNHPHRELADFRRKLDRRFAYAGSTFSGVGASDESGAVYDLQADPYQGAPPCPV
jgi:hypothetical protein